MKIFIDTSALFALLDGDDDNHKKAKKEWMLMLEQDSMLITSNYIVVEITALIQNRLGIDAVKALHESIMPLLIMEWTTPEIHRSSIGALLIASKRRLSLVDCSSFAIMRSLGINKAFTFDPHFKEQGFTCIP